MKRSQMTNTDSSQPQAEKFKVMAKELEADSDEKTFDKKLKDLTQVKMKPASK